MSQLILTAHQPSGEAEHPGCVPTAASAQPILAPNTAVLRRQAARAAGRERALHAAGAPQSNQAPSGRDGQHPEHRSRCPKAIQQGRIVQNTYGPASGARLQLFVRAADGFPERSWLFPAMAELTSNCTRSLWSIIVSSIITIALWCCIVLLPFGFQHNTATRLHSICGYSSMQDLIRCG